MKVLGEGSSLLSSVLFAQFGLAGVHQGTRSVRLHHFRLQGGAGAEVARVQVHERAGSLDWGRGLRLRLLLRLLLLQTSHLLSFAHLEHLVFGRAHLLN